MKIGPSESLMKTFCFLFWLHSVILFFSFFLPFSFFLSLFLSFIYLSIWLSVSLSLFVYLIYFHLSICICMYTCTYAPFFLSYVLLHSRGSAFLHRGSLGICISIKLIASYAIKIGWVKTILLLKGLHAAQYETVLSP